MLEQTQEKIFSSLKISKDQLLNEVSELLVQQQLSEYLMEIDYLEKKYNKNFEKFDYAFRNQKASYEVENDWMQWKFAIENRDYWQDILK
ncbi:MAG: hypothetical protein GY864_13135 [Desulfobacterales bacterium]|nr:hypothetical protein [Desulfobacterales bacterium]